MRKSADDSKAMTELLNRLPLFAKTDRAFRDHVCAHAAKKELEREVALWEPGAKSDDFAIVGSGRLLVRAPVTTKRGFALDVVKWGEPIGVMAALEGRPHTAFVEGHARKTTVWLIPAKAILGHGAASEQFLVNNLKVINRWLLARGAMYQALASSRSMDGDGLAIRLLLTLWRLGEANAPAIEQAEVGKFAGVAVARVSVGLDACRQKGWLTPDHVLTGDGLAELRSRFPGLVA